MVWFTFTFLLGIPNNSQKLDLGKYEKNSGKLNADKNYVEIEVSKPNFSCHVEYVLFPNEAPKFIDIVCWDEVGKVYFENSTCAFKPLLVQRLRWIHFRVNHEVKLLTEDIPVLHKYNMKINVTLGNKKFGESAKSDPIKKFYCPIFENEEETGQFIRKQLFQPVSETPQDIQNVSFFREHLSAHQQLYIALDTTIETSENYNLLMKNLLELSEEFNNNSHVRIPTPPDQSYPQLVSLNSDYEDESRVDKKQKEKPVEKKKEGTGDSKEFVIPGERFLSGNKIIEKCLKYNFEELPYLFSLVRVRHVLSRRQVEYYNPLSISIRHCNDLPIEDLKSQGVTVLKIQYIVCNQYLVESNLIPIDHFKKLNYERTILTNSTDKNQLINFIQTEGLKIHIFGNLERKHLIRPNIYDRNCKVTSKMHSTGSKNSNETNFVLLGTAFIDLSSVLNQPQRILVKSNMQMPSDSMASKKENFSNLTVINKYNSYYCTTGNTQLFVPFKTFSATLTVSVKMGYPLTKIYHSVLQNPNLLNRLFAVINDVNCLLPILQIVENEDKEILQPVKDYNNQLNLKRPLTKNHLGNVKTKENIHIETLTGFIITYNDKCLIFVEGILNGKIQQIWAIASSLKPSQGHVLYDGSLIFTERLYKNFVTLGGFLKISLKNEPQLTWIKSKKGCKNLMTKLAWKAIFTLNMLMSCKSIRTATQNNFFPDSDSLICMAIEFGIPIKMLKIIN